MAEGLSRCHPRTQPRNRVGVSILEELRGVRTDTASWSRPDGTGSYLAVVNSRMLIPVHAATRDPATPGPPVILGNGPTWGPQRTQPSLGEQLAAIDPAGEGIEMRWLGDQTDDCLAALNPSRFHSRGADEIQRFRAGAKARSDTAVSVFTLFDDESPRSVMFSGVTSVSVADYTSVVGARVGAGTTPRIADGLDPVDRDLANRLMQTVGSSDRWLAMNLSGSETHGVHGGELHQPEGRLIPLLVTQLNEPVAAVWVDDDSTERVYLLPEEQDWRQTLRWLVQHCLPRHAPNGLRHLRRDLLPVPENLRSIDEQRATAALDAVQAEFGARLRAAQDAAQQARETADGVRDALLYGTGSSLVSAVAGILRDAGLQVEDLDERFGDTISADLLVTGHVLNVLVEVKSSNQTASEDLAAKLTKHLATWPTIAPNDPLDRGVLVVNHQLRLPIEARTEQVYARKEFVDILRFQVIPTRTLLNWWLQQDWDTIRRVFGAPVSATPAAHSMNPRAIVAQPAKRFPFRLRHARREARGDS